MSAALILFLRLVLRPMWREPLRTSLTLGAVALGVAVVIAIDLAGDAAAGSFHASLESLSGKNDLTITATGGIDEQLLGKLVQFPYPFEFTPRIEDFAFINGKGEALPFIGLDLIARASVGSYRAPKQGSGTPVDPIWVGRNLNLHSGSRVRLLVNDRMNDFTVEGDAGEGNAIVADIGLAQRVTNKVGKLDSIDVTAPHGETVEYWRRFLERQLPRSLTVALSGSRTEENRKILAAFRWNVRVLSYIALLVGAFLIYNTISISVVRRRTEIGTVRALGATRGMVLHAFLAEALFFAACGGVLGLIIGRFMAASAVELMASTVKSLYVSSQPGAIHFSVAAVVSGVGLGFAVALLAAIGPAIEASRVPPVEAMARGREEYVVAERSRWTLVCAVFLFLLAGGLCRLPPVGGRPLFAYLAALLLVVGSAVAMPGVIAAVAEPASWLLRKLPGVEALLAMRGLRASLGRTSVLSAALATAVAMTASVGIMVGSFRKTVWVWMNDELKADLYLRPAGTATADRHPTMSDDIAAAIERLPGVAAVDRFRAYSISYEGVPATLGAGETSNLAASSGPHFFPGEDRVQILTRLAEGDYAVVSEPFANKHHVQTGSVIRLPLGGRERAFRVIGIYYDYSTERGFVILSRRTLLKYLPDTGLSNIGVFLKPGADPNTVRAGIDRAIAGRAVMVFTNSELRRAAIAVFDRTFRITYALEAVAVIVAVMGIAGALLALIIDRRREFALLRFLGASRPQVRRIVLCEAGLLGLLANVIGLALGLVLSLILIFVINKQSFGWTIQFHLPVAILLIALTGVYIATLLSGLYPARTATLMNPIEVIHEE